MAPLRSNDNVPSTDNNVLPLSLNATTTDTSRSHQSDMAWSDPLESASSSLHVPMYKLFFHQLKSLKLPQKSDIALLKRAFLKKHLDSPIFDFYFKDRPRSISSPTPSSVLTVLLIPLIQLFILRSLEVLVWAYIAILFFSTVLIYADTGLHAGHTISMKLLFNYDFISRTFHEQSTTELFRHLFLFIKNQIHMILNAKSLDIPVRLFSGILFIYLVNVFMRPAIIDLIIGSLQRWHLNNAIHRQADIDETEFSVIQPTKYDFQTESHAMLSLLRSFGSTVFVLLSSIAFGIYSGKYVFTIVAFCKFWEIKGMFQEHSNNNLKESRQHLGIR